MTTDKNFKRLVRERMTATGDRYTAAHAAMLEETPDRVRDLLAEFERAGHSGPDRGDNEHLLAEALRLIESEGDQPTTDLVHVAHRVLLHQWDMRARVKLYDKYLAQDLPVEEEAWARWHRADSMAILGIGDVDWCRRAVEAQRELAEFVESKLSLTQLPWVWHDATMAGAWSRLDLTEEWLGRVEPVTENPVVVPENRTDRYELLNTASSMYGVVGMSDRVQAMIAQMRRVLSEDPRWGERQWAQDRLHKQEMGNALRARDLEAMRVAAREYEAWIEAQEPPMLPSPLGDIGFRFLLAEDYGTAIHYCEKDVAGGNPYTFVWYAAAVMGQSADIDRAAELLREARRRMPSEEVLAAFQNQAQFAEHLEDEQLLAAMAP